MSPRPAPNSYATDSVNKIIITILLSHIYVIDARHKQRDGGREREQKLKKYFHLMQIYYDSIFVPSLLMLLLYFNIWGLLFMFFKCVCDKLIEDEEKFVYF